MKRVKLQFSLRIVQGAIGKKFVVKHYTYGIVKTKFPDMSSVVVSKGQRKCRDLFKEAVAFAKLVIADDHLRGKWKKKLKAGKRIFNAVIKAYMLMEKAAREQQAVIGRRIIRNCFKIDAPYSNEYETKKSLIVNAKWIESFIVQSNHNL